MADTAGHEKRMPFLDHLEELRKKLLVTLFFFLAATVAAFIFIEPIMTFLELPIDGYGLTLHYFKPHEKFFTYVKTAVFTGLVATVPFLIVQVGLFVSPALKSKEKRVFNLILFFLVLLFAGGCFFAYTAIAPTAFRFFIGFAAEDGVLPVWGIGAYYEVLFKVVFFIGLAFELPLILLFTVAVDILSVRALARGRKIALLVSFIFGAVLTPPDLFTQILVGSILYILYEVTILAAKLISRKRKRIHEYV